MMAKQESEIRDKMCLEQRLLGEQRWMNERFDHMQREIDDRFSKVAETLKRLDKQLNPNADSKECCPLRCESRY